MKKSIAFLFPRIDTGPVGGYKIVYEYANRFASDGWDVILIYPQMIYKDWKNNLLWKLLRQLKNRIIFIFRKFWHIEKKALTWFPLDERIKKEYVWKFRESISLKNHDTKFVATALITAYELSSIQKENFEQRNFYFVQGFESWGNQSPKDVYNSYKLPLTKITITPWLAERIESVGEKAFIVENGLDFDYFKMTIQLQERKSYQVAMLFHESEIKRSWDAINALKIVKEKVPELCVTMFGVSLRPDLPDWFKYYQKPNKDTHNAIYNNAAIFVAPSRLEGMGLTPAESMICGCAVACTDNPGFSIFAKNNETALISPAMDIQALADNILKLISDKELRFRIAKNGNSFIKQFTWEKSYKKFKEIVEK